MFKICYQENYLYPILQFNDFQKELDSCMRFSFPSQTPPKKKKIGQRYASNRKNGNLNG